jgi:hypothetical protein
MIRSSDVRHLDPLWDERWVRQKYEAERMSMESIARRLGCSSASVFHGLRRAGVQSRGGPGSAAVFPEKACASCGNMFRARGYGNRRRVQACCSRRCARRFTSKRLEDSLGSKEWLTAKYVDECLSTRQIARMLLCSDFLVCGRLKAFGIPARSHSEAKKVLFDRQGRKDVSQAELIAAYGGKCSCCGESEPAFLTLDHVGGGGAAHRRAIKKKSEGRANVTRKLRQELKAQGWPKDKYRLLCMNCNFATGHKKACPHQLKEEAAVPPAANPTPDPKAVRTVAELVAVLLTMPQGAAALGTWEGVAVVINDVRLDGRGRVLIDVDQ